MLNSRCALLVSACLLLFIGTPKRVTAQDLNVYMTASTDVLNPDNGFIYTLTVTNSGAVSLTDVSVMLTTFPNIYSFENPGFTCNGSCRTNSIYSWNVGTLEAGESRSASSWIFVLDDASGEQVSTALASATGVSDVQEELKITVLTEPDTRVSLCLRRGRCIQVSRFLPPVLWQYQQPAYVGARSPYAPPERDTVCIGYGWRRS